MTFTRLTGAGNGSGRQAVRIPFPARRYLYTPGSIRKLLGGPNASSEAYLEIEQYPGAWTSQRDVFQRKFKDRHFASICKLAFKV